MNFAFLKNSGAKRSKLSTARESADTCLQDASYGAITGFIPMRRYSLCFHYRADFCRFLSPLQNPLVCFRRSVVHLRAIDDKRVVPVHLVRVRTYLREESEKFVRVYENSLFSYGSTNRKLSVADCILLPRGNFLSLPLADAWKCPKGFSGPKLVLRVVATCEGKFRGYRGTWNVFGTSARDIKQFK